MHFLLAEAVWWLNENRTHALGHWYSRAQISARRLGVEPTTIGSISRSLRQDTDRRFVSVFHYSNA